MLSLLLWVVVGSPYPVAADATTWFWLFLSGLVGYVFGDYCLFNSYVIFGSRYGQLFMTLAPPIAGIAGWLMLGEKMSGRSWIAMLVTLIGIAISILVRGSAEEKHKIKLELPLKGVLFGIGAGVGQGVGVSLSLMAVQYAKAGIASTLMALTPVLIIVPYALINHQRITFKEVFGTLVTIAGVAMFFL